MADSSTALCKCGEELPPGKKGEVLHCIHCGRNYRALGKGKVELAVDKNLVSTQEGDAEVFRFDVPDEAEVKASKSKSSIESFDDKGSTIKIDLREKRRQAEKRRSAVTARATGQTIPESSTRPKAMRAKQPGQIPGGIMPMVIFIVVFNAIAFIGLGVFFPTKEGITHTPWGSSFAKPNIPWLEMLALVLGHAMGFGAWAIYVHQLHLKQKAAREKERAAAARANNEDDDDEEEDEDDDRAEEKLSRKGV